MIQEVDAMMQNSRNILDSVELHERNISACENILKLLNPVYAKELQRDEAIDNISGRMDHMEEVLSRLESMLAKSNNNDREVL